MNKKTVIIVSVLFVLIIAALIIVLSFTGPDNSGTNEKEHNNRAAMEHLASSATTAGENLETVEKGISPEEFAGYYVDKNDGWYYNFTYSPTGDYAGTFVSGFDPEYKSENIVVDLDVKHTGEWKLEKGEIKLYSEGTHQDSMWACDGYIVDSKYYFVGDIDADSTAQQAMFVCKAPQLIINLYSDNKVILETQINKDEADLAAQPATVNEMYAGTYKIVDGMLITTIGQQVETYHIVNDGFAKWIYNKV